MEYPQVCKYRVLRLSTIGDQNDAQKSKKFEHGKFGRSLIQNAIRNGLKKANRGSLLRMSLLFSTSDPCVWTRMLGIDSPAAVLTMTTQVMLREEVVFIEVYNI